MRERDGVRDPGIHLMILDFTPFAFGGKGLPSRVLFLVPQQVPLRTMVAACLLCEAGGGGG